MKNEKNMAIKLLNFFLNRVIGFQIMNMNDEL